MNKPLFKRLLKWLIVLELAYLAVFNIALNLPLTQDLINRIKPDKFFVSWENAWTPWPFRVYARGVAANGQARSQQWELHTPEARASISILPLLLKTVNLNGVHASDIRYYQRPRPKEGKDYSAIREFFPPITGRKLETSLPQLAPVKPGKKPWQINIQGIQAKGKHQLWLYQAKAVINGKAGADLSVQTRGGPFSLDQGQVDLNIETLTINGDDEILSDSLIKGNVDLLPFVIKQNKGLKSLAFLKLNAELDMQTRSLAFLNLYLNAFEGMRLDGEGKVGGRLVLDQGMLLPQSDLNISARSLNLDLLDYHLEGDGDVRLWASEQHNDSRFVVAFNDLEAYVSDNTAPLLTGQGLVINGTGSGQLLVEGNDQPVAKNLALSISALKVPDISRFQRFIPAKWALKLLGGEGLLQGQITASNTSLTSDIRLNSDDAEIGIKDFTFGSNLDMGLVVNSPELETGHIDISGTHLKLSEARVSSEESASSPWYAEIVIERGGVSLNTDDATDDAADTTRVAQAVKDGEIGQLLAEADEDLKIRGRISDLTWLNVLIDNPYDLKIRGNGEINSDILIDSGWLGTGSQINITPQNMGVELLDYIAEGEGEVQLLVSKGGETPDISLDLKIGDAELRRKHEDQAMIEKVDMHLLATARNIQLGVPEQDMQLQLNIPSARIRDMSIYNSYLPEQSPLQILGGEASLTADLKLEPDDANGFIHLDASDLSARVDEQEVSATLTGHILLRDGQPRDMAFDISDSMIKLDDVRVKGEQDSFREEDWATDIRFTRASTVWKKPVQLDVEADLQMTNSIPLVSMLANHRDKHGWLEKALTIDDVEGELSLQIANQQIVIPHAFVGSDNIDVGAKAVINRDTRNGMVFVRYKALKGLLKVKDGKRNIDILKAQEKFDNWSTAEFLQEQEMTQD